MAITTRSMRCCKGKDTATSYSHYNHLKIREDLEAAGVALFPFPRDDDEKEDTSLNNKIRVRYLIMLWLWMFVIYAWQCSAVNGHQCVVVVVGGGGGGGGVVVVVGVCVKCL